MKKKLPNLQSTLDAAKVFSEQIQPGQVIYLEGELGAGKTTFVQGVLKALGYEGVVTSPTYTLVEPYALPQLTVFHFDLYRLNDPAELEFIGIKDYFTNSSIVFIEWPERAGKLIPAADWRIELCYGDNGRWINIKAKI